MLTEPLNLDFLRRINALSFAFVLLQVPKNCKTILTAYEVSTLKNYLLLNFYQ